MRRAGLIGIANARRFAEEGDAVMKIGLALALDRGENVCRNGLDLGRTQEDGRLGDPPVAQIASRQIVAGMRGRGVVGVNVTLEKRHAGSRSSAHDRMYDLVFVELRLAQRERCSAVAATAAAVPFVTTHAIGANVHRAAFSERVLSGEDG